MASRRLSKKVSHNNELYLITFYESSIYFVERIEIKKPYSYRILWVTIHSFKTVFVDTQTHYDKWEDLHHEIFNWTKRTFDRMDESYKNTGSIDNTEIINW